MADEADSLEKQLQDAERILNETESEVKSAAKTEEVVATPEVKTEVITEVIPEKKDDEEEGHSEKSRLGRKVKRLEETLTDIRSSLDFIKERTTTPQVQSLPIDEDDELPDGATSEEIKDFVKKRETRLLKALEQRESDKERDAREKKTSYAKEYAKTLESMVDPEEDEEIFKLLTDTKDLTYNQVYRGNPVEDFLINYRGATKAVLRKATPGTKTTVANKPSAIPTGVNVPGGTKPATKVIDTSKWSRDEQELAKMFSSDELAEMGI